MIDSVGFVSNPLAAFPHAAYEDCVTLIKARTIKCEGLPGFGETITIFLA
jgi:hypothetical protein